MKLDINLLKENPAELEEFAKTRKELEKNGKFHTDENAVDPDSYDPITEDFPFIRKGFAWWLKGLFYNGALNSYAKKINKNLTNLQIVGKENLKGVKGAIITCNHISKADSFAVREAVAENIMFVASEYNNWKGPMGVIARNTGYIPLNLTPSLKLMRKFNESIHYYLGKKKKILIYPEQAMWREYKKPRPLQNGAFHYAALNNVPILPLFITITPKESPVDEQGRANFGNYTIHILPPIYPEPTRSVKENEHFLKMENYCLWKDCYETTYGKPLKYDTTESVWKEKYSSYDEVLTQN